MSANKFAAAALVICAEGVCTVGQFIAFTAFGLKYALKSGAVGSVTSRQYKPLPVSQQYAYLPSQKTRQVSQPPK